MKVIKINVETQTIENVTIENSSKDIYAQIGNGCALFCIPVQFENGDDLFADDESLLRENDIKGGFIMPDWRIPIVGNAVIFGTTWDGDNCDCKTTIENLKDKVKFLDAKTCQDYAKAALNGQPFKIIEKL